MRTRIRKWGNSLALRIPKHIADELGLSSGSEVNVEVIEDRLEVTKRPERRLTWDEVFAHPIEAGSAKGESWVYDTLFDADLDDKIDAELDALEANRPETAK